MDPSPWRTLFRLARPFRSRILIIIFLAALSTGASLIEPLIYRVAGNDVAGLFVRKAQEENEQAQDDLSSLLETEAPETRFKEVTYQTEEQKVSPGRNVRPREKNIRHRARFLEPHRRGHVSPRTPEQTLHTFIWALGLMFGLSVFAYLVWLVADNIRYQRIETSDEEVRAAALAAGLGPALDRLPEGLQSQVGEGGMGLSIGERQRLQLARVLVANPRITVHDEATANLDYATELEVKSALAKLRKDRTTIVIAHRFSMVKDADYVYVLESGRVSEAGTPDDLIDTGGWFAGFATGGLVEEDSEDPSEDSETEIEDEEVVEVDEG